MTEPFVTGDIQEYARIRSAQAQAEQDARPEYLLVCEAHQASIRTSDPVAIEEFEYDHADCGAEDEWENHLAGE